MAPAAAAPAAAAPAAMAPRAPAPQPRRPAPGLAPGDYQDALHEKMNELTLKVEKQDRRLKKVGMAVKNRTALSMTSWSDVDQETPVNAMYPGAASGSGASGSGATHNETESYDMTAEDAPSESAPSEASWVNARAPPAWVASEQ